MAEAHTLHEVQASHRALEQAGLPVEWLTSEQVRSLTHAHGFHGGYRLDGGGCVSPEVAALSLADASVEAGGMVIEEVDVRGTCRKGGVVHCETDRGEVKAEMVVYATHVDSRRFSEFAGDEVVPIRGQGMVASRGAPVFKGAFATHWKLNVWRSDGAGRLILGGWRHDAWDRSYWKTRPEVDEHLQADIEGWFGNTFTDTPPLKVERRWSGIFGWTADYLPMIGPLPGRVGEMVVCGFSGGGLPFAFESGRVIAAIVTEGEPVLGSELFNPRRFS
jgi:glycine/D-amino acid oxidase-like deaminating enzyme